MSEPGDYPRYSVILEWEPQDRIYIATVPELSGCRTHGATMAEAVKNAQEVIELWVDSAREKEWQIPAPRHFDLDGPNPPGWGR
jgi:predicted RNase H-like HicB family nuclease